MVTRSEVFDLALADDRRIESLLTRESVVIHEGATVRAAADRMILEGVGRLVVVAAPENERRVVAIITRSDLLGAHERRLDEASRPHVSFPLPKLFGGRSRHQGPPASHESGRRH